MHAISNVFPRTPLMLVMLVGEPGASSSGPSVSARSRKRSRASAASGWFGLLRLFSIFLPACSS
jgi:hypothetical protein